MQSQQDDGSSTTLNQALELLQKGDSAGALRTVQDALAQAEKDHGAASAQAAAAHHDVGIVFGSSGQLDKAIEHMRKACAPEVSDPNAAKMRLTYELSLAAMLEQTGKVSDARALIEQNLAARKLAFGAEHPGFAIGLEQLGGFLLRHNELEAARNASEHAAAIFGNNGHPGIISALVLRTEVLKTMGASDPPYEGLEAMPSALVEHLTAATLERVNEVEPEVGAAILKDLAPFVEAKLGPEHLASLHVWNSFANVARNAQDHAGRESALKSLIAGLDKRADIEQTVEAFIALALAYGDAGEAEKALGAFDESAKRGKMLGKAGHRTRALRNKAMLLVDLDRLDEALVAVNEALKDAEEAMDGNNHARANVVLGVVHRYRNEDKLAKPALETALTGIAPTDPDAKLAQQHLDDLNAGKAAEKIKPGDDIAEFIRNMVKAKAPPGLLKDLDIKFDGDQPDVSLNLAREASAEEIGMLEMLIQQSIVQFAQHHKAKGN